jgi:hypothetical protein
MYPAEGPAGMGFKVTAIRKRGRRNPLASAPAIGTLPAIQATTSPPRAPASRGPTAPQPPLL